MAEPRVPILQNGLTLPERVMLAGLTRHVGFPVLVKLIEGLCTRATENLVKLDPELENYERLLIVRQQKSRTTHENARDIRDSIEYHISMAGKSAELDLDNQLQLQENTDVNTGNAANAQSI